MNTIKFLSGLFLLIWGVWCFVAAIKKRKLQAMASPSDEFIPKRIFGRYYDVIMNILTGIVCIAFGIMLIKTNFSTIF